MRSISRITVAVAFVLALLLSTVPTQAQPLDFGFTSDASWLDVAFSWLEDLFGGGGAESLQTIETGGSRPTGPGGNYGTMSGSCLDPMGNPCGDNNG